MNKKIFEVKKINNCYVTSERAIEQNIRRRFIMRNLVDNLVQLRISAVDGAEHKFAIMNFKPAHETIIHMLMCEHYAGYHVESVEKVEKKWKKYFSCISRTTQILKY